jgi:hypothetical protein
MTAVTREKISLNLQQKHAKETDILSYETYRTVHAEENWSPQKVKG